jgi:hypothetical protein
MVFFLSWTHNNDTHKTAGAFLCMILRIMHNERHAVSWTMKRTQKTTGASFFIILYYSWDIVFCFHTLHLLLLLLLFFVLEYSRSKKFDRLRVRGWVGSVCLGVIWRPRDVTDVLRREPWRTSTCPACSGGFDSQRILPALFLLTAAV